MTDLHPNWTTDGPEEQPIPVRITEKPKQNPEPPRTDHPHAPRMHRLSRQPAAIAGMLLALSIGLSLFFSFDGDPEILVRITEQGFSPQTVTVTAGSTVRWVNQTDRPHVLQSDALCTRNQECFSTRSIGPEESATLTITPDFSAGTYAYYSINTHGMEASITVRTGGTDTAPATAGPTTQQNLAQAVPFDTASQGSSVSSGTESSASVSSQKNPMAFAFPDDDAGDDAFVDLTSVLTEGAGSSQPPFRAAAGNPDFPTVGDSSSASRSADSVTQLPLNPYTVSGTRTHPFDAEGKPLAAGAGSSAKSTLHGSAPRPLSQPATGPALWITLFGTFGLLFIATRNLLKSANI